MSKSERQRGQWYVLTALGGAGVILEQGAGASGGPGHVAHVECYEDAVEIVRWWNARLTNPKGGDADERRRDDSSPAVHQPYVATPTGSADEQDGSVGECSPERAYREGYWDAAKASGVPLDSIQDKATKAYLHSIAARRLRTASEEQAKDEARLTCSDCHRTHGIYDLDCSMCPECGGTSFTVEPASHARYKRAHRQGEGGG